jgi:hypothetical protein
MVRVFHVLASRARADGEFLSLFSVLVRGALFSHCVLFVKPTCTQTDPKGSLPTSIVNQVSLAQPKSLIIAKQLLEKKKQSNSLLRSPTASVSYQGAPSLQHL